MLLTRLLPPQFLLPAWTTRQLAQVAQRAHKSDYTKEHQDSNDDYQGRQPTKRQLRRLQWSNVRRVNIRTVGGEDDLNSSQAAAEKELDEPSSVEQGHYTSRPGKERERHDVKILEREDDGNGFILYTPMKPPEDEKRAGATGTPRLREKNAMQSTDQESQSSPKQLSLFEELFPEEALARQRREKKALERLEKLPAFNWNAESKELDSRERKHEQARIKTRGNYTSIPELNTGARAQSTRPSPQAKEVPQDRSTRLARLSGKHSRVSILVLKACSKTLEESDFYRVGPKGNHIESWTNGILKGMALLLRSSLLLLISTSHTCSRQRHT